MLVQDINIETIVTLLKELPNQKQYLTHSIILAKGRYKYNNSVYNRIKRLING
jgi:hypothetical protein